MLNQLFLFISAGSIMTLALTSTLEPHHIQRLHNSVWYEFKAVTSARDGVQRTVTFPNGRQETFTMDRWQADTWIGRPDLVAARWEGYKTANDNLFEFYLFDTNNENTVEVTK